MKEASDCKLEGACDGPINLFNLQVAPDLLSACIHCGLCLPACPTYLATGHESQSPRGRIYAVMKSQGGQVERALDHLSTCLGCLGCQTACPSGVQYESILEQVRPALAARRSWPARTAMRLFFRLLGNYGLLRLLFIPVRFVQRLSLDRLPEVLVRLCPFLKGTWLGRLASWRQFTPAVPVHKSLPARLAGQGAEKPVPVQFFQGCVMDIFYNQVNHAAMKALAGAGLTCNLPRQTCCGALAFHAGDVDIARQLAKANMAHFENLGGEIVVASAGCGAMLKGYEHLFAEGEPERARAAQFSRRVKDFSQVMASHLPPQPQKRESGAKEAPRVAYHAACHLAHAQGVRAEPEAVLNRLAAEGCLQRVPLADAEHCCGSAGIYNLLNTELSLQVLEAKMDSLQASGAEVVVTANPGCLLQLEAGVRARGLNVKVKHLAELCRD